MNLRLSLARVAVALLHVQLRMNLLLLSLSHLTRSPLSSGAGGSARSPGGRGDVYSSPSSAGRGDGEERSPYDPWRFDPDNHRVYNVGPEGRSSHPIGYPMERGPCSVLDLVLSGSLRGLDMAELREISHDCCEVFVFRAQPGGGWIFVLDCMLIML